MCLLRVFDIVRMNFDRSDLRKLIYYCWRRDLTTAAIEKEINKTLGAGTVSVRTCADWVAKFKAGDYNVSDKERSGRPSYELEEDITAVLDGNRHATCQNIANEIGTSRDYVRKTLLKMGKRYLCNSWVPHMLSDAQKANRKEICEELLAKYHRNNFLHRLITVDESWIYWEGSTSYHHKSWRGSEDETVAEARRTLTNKKHLLTVFWDCKGVVLMDVLPCGQAMNAQHYCELLDKLSIAVMEKRRRRMADGFLYLQQDNARPHTARITTEKLQSLKLNVIPHPPTRQIWLLPIITFSHR